MRGPSVNKPTINLTHARALKLRCAASRGSAVDSCTSPLRVYRVHNSIRPEHIIRPAIGPHFEVGRHGELFANLSACWNSRTDGTQTARAPAARGYSVRSPLEHPDTSRGRAPIRATTSGMQTCPAPSFITSVVPCT
jgi:hypothetical protein